SLREKYLRADSAFTALRLLDSQLEMSEEAALINARKAGMLKLAVLLLMVSAALLGVDVIS
ncbi:MAG: hypothetical protein ABR507_09430, partial [Actinomycetota bacterium]